MEKTMAITTEQREQIVNWVNSSNFNSVLDEIIARCVEGVNSFCGVRDRGENVRWMLPLTAKMFVDDYLLTAKLPFVHSPSMKIYIAEEILKKYGSLLDKKINEQLRTNNIQTDF